MDLSGFGLPTVDETLRRNDIAVRTNEHRWPIIEKMRANYNLGGFDRCYLRFDYAWLEYTNTDNIPFKMAVLYENVKSVSTSNDSTTKNILSLIGGKANDFPKSFRRRSLPVILLQSPAHDEVHKPFYLVTDVRIIVVLNQAAQIEVVLEAKWFPFSKIFHCLPIVLKRLLAG